MKTKRAFTAWLVVVVVALGSTAWGFPGASGDDPQWFFGGPVKRLIMDQIGRLLIFRSQLDLTPQQREKIATVVKKHMDEIVPTAKAVLEKRQSLQEAVLKDAGNEKAIRAAATDLTKSVGDAAVLAAKVIAEARPILSEKQVDLIAKYRAGRQEAVIDWLDQLAKK
jgi:Spy/CpxP family protein refolding chaperone